jgi:hypothetical protein
MRSLQMEGSQASINEEDLQSFETRYGVTLPEDYKQFLLQHNGGKPNVRRYKTRDGFITTSFMWAYSLEEMTKDYETLCLGDMIPRNLLPIGLDPGRSRVCISLSGQDQGVVYHWDLDGEHGEIKPTYDHIYPVADSFADFLDVLFVPKALVLSLFQKRSGMSTRPGLFYFPKVNTVLI